MEFVIYFNRTILFVACFHGSFDIVKYLISLNKFNPAIMDIKLFFLFNFFRKGLHQVLHNIFMIFKNLFFYNTLLHVSFFSRNNDLIKYIISLDTINLRVENIFSIVFFDSVFFFRQIHVVSILFVFMEFKN